jgi:predicted xylose isomerase-like sugar epimerase
MDLLYLQGNAIRRSNEWRCHCSAQQRMMLSLFRAATNDVVIVPLNNAVVSGHIKNTAATVGGTVSCSMSATPTQRKIFAVV